MKTAPAVRPALPRPESFRGVRTAFAATALALAAMLPATGFASTPAPTTSASSGPTAVPATVLPAAKPAVAPAAKPAVAPASVRRQGPAPQTRPAQPAETSGSCLESILAMETEFGIPRGLLLGIALVESGRGGYPAPFALNIRGRAIYAKNEADAARYLRDPQGRLRGGVMAGCMQLSLSHHKNSFRPVEKIVEPRSNVRFAARYLVRLRGETGSWAGAVARYNGGTNGKGRLYQCKVLSQLTALGAPSADLFDASRCKPAGKPVIAEATRRAFDAVNAKPLS